MARDGTLYTTQATLRRATAALFFTGARAPAPSRAQTMSVEDQETSFVQIASDDLSFRTEAAKDALAPLAEAAALRTLFSQHFAVCSAKLGEARWGQCVSRWDAWKDAEPAVLGIKIEAAVTSLDAVHLKPTGILERLEGGLDAACYGLATLVLMLPAREP